MRNLSCQKWVLVAVVTTLFNLPALVSANAAKTKNKLEFDHPMFRVRLIPRTPEQMAAFYEARGFPKPALDAVKKQCFITVGVSNKSKTIVWLDMSSWRFESPAGPLRRLDRQYWKSYWKTLPLEQRFQSTFRWTLIPETLDYRPEETEGGNIILPRTGKPFTIRAQFKTGTDKSGPSIDMIIENVRCAEDPKS